MSRDQVLVVGAGLSGAVLARTLAEAGIPSRVLDQRDHVAGNCHTSRDPETEVMVHRYGPHVFHTGDQEVWELVQRFARFEPYVSRIKAVARGRVYPLPINLLTLNTLFERAMGPEEARAFLEAQGDRSIGEPTSFEEQALKFLGKTVYRTLLQGYTRKQWGRPPSELPASVLRRLPVRFSYDDNYFDHPHQGIPREGFTVLAERMLDHPAIDLELGTPFDHRLHRGFRHLFWSGPLDQFFDYSLGRLEYRTLRFEAFRGEGDHQGCAQLNYCDPEVPWTRVTEFRHYTPWERPRGTYWVREYSSACGPGDIPYYPVRLAQEKALLERYQAEAAATPGVTFLGRLGTYRYLDMDVTVRQALEVARGFLEGEGARKDV